MKKIISLLLVVVVCFSISACRVESENSPTLEDVIQQFEKATGETYDREEKPIFSMIGAEDGIIFYFSDSNRPIKLYEFKDKSAYTEAKDSFGDTGIADWPNIGMVVLETSNGDALEVFDAIANGEAIPDLTDLKSEASAESAPESSDPAESSKPTKKDETAEVTQTLLSFGEMITVSDWEITVNSYEVTQSIQNSEYTSFKADEGSQYVLVNLTIKNIGTKANRFLEYLSLDFDNIVCKIFYQDKYEYTATELLAYDKDLHNSQLNPLETATGIIAYSVVNEAAQSSELTFHIKSGSDEYVYKLENPTVTETAVEEPPAEVQEAPAEPEPQSVEEPAPEPEYVEPEPYIEPDLGYLPLDEIEAKYNAEFIFLSNRYVLMPSTGGIGVWFPSISDEMVEWMDNWELTGEDARIKKEHGTIYVHDGDVSNILG